MRLRGRGDGVHYRYCYRSSKLLEKADGALRENPANGLAPPRFTIRSLMIAVAIVGGCLGLYELMGGHGRSRRLWASCTLLSSALVVDVSRFPSPLGGSVLEPPLSWRTSPVFLFVFSPCHGWFISRFPDLAVLVPVGSGAGSAWAVNSTAVTRCSGGPRCGFGPWFSGWPYYL